MKFLRIPFVPFFQGLGSLLIAYGLIRDSFGGGIPPRVADPRAMQAPQEQIFAQMQEIALHIGGKLGLVPTEHALTAMERRLDAELAIIGFLLLILAAIIGVAKKMLNR